MQSSANLYVSCMAVMVQSVEHGRDRWMRLKWYKPAWKNAMKNSIEFLITHAQK